MHVHPTFITVYLGQRKIGEKTTSNCVYRDENKTKYQHDCIKLLHTFPNRTHIIESVNKCFYFINQFYRILSNRQTGQLNGQVNKLDILEL